MAGTKPKLSRRECLKSETMNDGETPNGVNDCGFADMDPFGESGADQEEEEMKIFTDPALRKSKMANRKAPPKRSFSVSSSRDGETSVSVIGTLKATEEFSGNNLMTRRITIAGGFLDIALFTANCEQLKFLLELGELHIYYHHVLGLIIASLVLQLLVGLTMCLLSCHVIKKASDENYADYLNHATIGLVALITIVNIFISTFGPKGTIVTRLFRAFVYPNHDNPLWMAYLNATRNYMTEF